MAYNTRKFPGYLGNFFPSVFLPPSGLLPRNLIFLLSQAWCSFLPAGIVVFLQSRVLFISLLSYLPSHLPCFNSESVSWYNSASARKTECPQLNAWHAASMQTPPTERKTQGWEFIFTYPWDFHWRRCRGRMWKDSNRGTRKTGLKTRDPEGNVADVRSLQYDCMMYNQASPTAKTKEHREQSPSWLYTTGA